MPFLDWVASLDSRWREEEKPVPETDGLRLLLDGERLVMSLCGVGQCQGLRLTSSPAASMCGRVAERTGRMDAMMGDWFPVLPMRRQKCLFFRLAFQGGG